MNTRISLSAFFKLTVLALIFTAFAAVAHAQDKKERKSPLMNTSAAVMGHEVTIEYSAPAKKDRVIFGELVPYGKIWRTGANEATVLTLTHDMKVEGTLLKAGKYAIFTVPGENSWEIIFNEVWDQWGAYNYDSEKDVHRFSVKPKTLKEPVENFTINIDESGRVTMKWDLTEVSFNIE